ncbi:MAG: serine/threonine protein kinase [Planctomycetes bacterium]|nr:serine/threonine protein kinase [Planctomycetota bacterium]
MTVQRPTPHLPSRADPTQPAVRVVSGYRVVGELGQGGMATVYRAIQLSLDRQVALKVLEQSGPPDQAVIERFVREARAAGRISHPNVVTCFDVGVDQDRVYMALELMTGGDAGQLAEHHGGRLPERRALELIRDAARGLGAIHAAGLIHRDIKPANIFIAADGSGKLGDFGLVREAIDRRGIELTTDAVGTPVFMSPEQAMGGREIDIRSDIWSLGACLFTLVSGRPPYLADNAWQVIRKVSSEPAPDLAQIMPEASTAVVALVRRCMARGRDQRFQTPAELQRAAERALGYRTSGVYTTRQLHRAVVPPVGELWARAGVGVAERGGPGATLALALGPDGPVLFALALGAGAAERLRLRVTVLTGTDPDPDLLVRALHADGLAAAAVVLDVGRRQVRCAASAGAHVLLADPRGPEVLRLVGSEAGAAELASGRVLLLAAGAGAPALPAWSELLRHAEAGPSAVADAVAAVLPGAAVGILAG